MIDLSLLLLLWFAFRNLSSGLTRRRRRQTGFPGRRITNRIELNHFQRKGKFYREYYFSVNCLIIKLRCYILNVGVRYDLTV